MTPPFGALRFLYVGVANFEQDLAFYQEQLGAARVWQFASFGARVAALRLGDGPLLLLADHRPAPSCMPIYEVADLESDAPGAGGALRFLYVGSDRGRCLLPGEFPAGSPARTLRRGRPPARPINLPIFQDIRRGSRKALARDSEGA